MKDMARLLEKWQLNVGDVREQMYRAPTPRERERWHGLWLLVQGWSVTQVAEALERDSHTIGDWLSGFRRAGAQGLVFEHTHLHATVCWGSVRNRDCILYPGVGTCF